MTAERALRIARTSTHAEISAALALAPRRSIENAIFRSFVAGEPAASQSLDVMMRALTKKDEDAPHAADRAITMLLRRNQLRRACAVVDAVPEVPASLRPLRDAHIALIAARDGSDALAYEALERAEPQQEEDELLTGLLKHRAAHTYLLLRRYDLAMRRGLSAALHFERTNAKLLAAFALLTPMRIARLVRGDVATAREYAERGLRLALEHGFGNFADETRPLLLLYAAELGDKVRYRRLEPETPAHSFEAVVARAIHTIESGNIAQARRDLARGRVRDLRSPERLLCDALSAVCAFGLSDPMPATTVVDAVLEDHPFPRDAVQRRVMIIAHGITTSLAVALDRSHDARLIGARLRGLLEEALVDYALGHAMSVPPALRGYVTAIDVVRRAQDPARAIHLTQAERRLIPMLSQGKDVGRIARETKRSVATVRTHLEHIREKLGVARSEDVPQRARDLGIA